MSLKIIVTTVVAMSALAYAVCTHAATLTDSDTVSVKVSMADLDLGSQAGAAVALRRIDNAARIVCGEEPAMRDMDRAVAYRACMKATVGHAVDTLGNPIVFALNGGHHDLATFLASR